MRAENLKERLTVAGCCHFNLNPVTQLLIDVLRGAIEAPKFIGLHVLPLSQEGPPALATLLLGPLDPSLLLTERAKLLDLAPKTNELLTIDAGFLKLPQDAFVLSLRLLLAGIPFRSNLTDSSLCLLQRGFERFDHLLNVAFELF